ncbi:MULTISPECIES: hypothetical protein [Actinopolyspora]|uniref:Uncharacterized protein n=1 Tax=Actinopolyspora saharensis TaxID=995062 RepID=A0A1H0ZH01_9ACTN|nr:MULTISPECIES: hypothetical protein [Actinopolyspora]NHD15795.1 hypothetical protein [Actinopolyspora sp. BKK2]NHE74991.1 hypothetical protein [Actinopolyspora sp. BKK1]SDQ26717.1 hypothetical protein SAMN04489718_1041 [Actinopolyspora saharensis]
MYSNGTTILLIGSSAELEKFREWAHRSGFRLVEEVDPEVRYVIADEDVLDGSCTPEQGRALARAREAGVECLSPATGQSCLRMLLEGRAPEGVRSATVLTGGR